MQRAAKYVRYNGRLYVQALEAPKPNPLDPGAAPGGVPDPFAERTEELQKEEPTPEEAVNEHLTTVFGAVAANAGEALGTAEIKVVAADPKMYGADEKSKDKLSLAYNTSVDNFKGMKSALYFNYSVRGVNAEGAPSTLWDSAKALAEKLGADKVKSILGRSSFPLESVVFAYCDANHGAKSKGSIPNVPKLLEAVGIAQNPRICIPLKGRPPGNPVKGADEIKLLKEVIDFVNERQKEAPEEVKPDWGSKEYVKKLLDAINSSRARILNDKTLKSIKEFIDEVDRFEEFMGALEKQGPDAAAKISGVAITTDVLQKAIEPIVNKGKYTINFTGWKNMVVSANEDGSEVYAELHAPMLPLFVFDPRSGKPVFKSMNIQFCERAGLFLETKNPQNASKLAWTGVVITKAKAVALNPPKPSYFRDRQQLLSESAKKALEQAARGQPVTTEEEKKPAEEGGGPTPMEAILPPK